MRSLAAQGHWVWPAGMQDPAISAPHLGLGTPPPAGACILGRPWERAGRSWGGGARCKPRLTRAPQAEQSQPEEVRLRPVVSGARRQLPVTEGIVEVRYKDGWAQICDEGWDSRNSRVVCGMMGFPAEKKVNRNFYK